MTSEILFPSMRMYILTALCSTYYTTMYTTLSISREDKRSPDFNGDRETMEYQGLDPDARGPFVFASGGSMIRPA